MKKLIVILFVFLTLVLVGIYTLLFTPPGNDIVASNLESKVNDDGRVNFKVNTFVLTTSSIDFFATIDDNSKIKVKGALDIFAQSADLTYDVDVEDLSKLKKLTNTQFNGSLKTSGTVKGDPSSMAIKGMSDAFGSQTTYSANLVDLEPKDINFDIKKAKIDKLLYMLNQPIYAKGFIDINGNINNMVGDIKTKISSGVVDNKIVNEKFTMKLKNLLAFKGDIFTSLNKNVATTKVDFNTTMADIFVKKAVVKFDDASIVSDYQVKVTDLGNLYDVSQMKLRGNLVINGTIEKDKDLTITGISNFLGGVLNYTLVNNDLSSTIKDVEVVKALHMLYYPEFFTSKTDLNLDYNLASKKGAITGQLNNGQFLRNQFSDILNTFAKFDITKEVYEFVNIKSNINDNLIDSVVDMQSKYTKIVVPNSKIDTKKRTVSALVQTTIKKISFDTTISGTFDKPKVKVDTSKLLTNTAKEKAKEKLNKKIEEKLGGDAGELLKGLFK